MSYDIIIGRDEADKKSLGDKGLVFLGKGYVKMGQYTSLSNRIFMDVARSHVILVAGKRGSGKSYTLGVLAEELANLPREVSQNIASIIFDTMGIYWTMKFRNEKDRELLADWNLKTKDLPVKIFVPKGYYDNYLSKSIPADEKFALDVSEMNQEDWLITFNLEITHPISVIIERVVSSLKAKKSYNIKDIISKIEDDKRSTQEVRNAASALFEAADGWGIFADNSSEATIIRSLVTPGKTTIIDLSVYNSIGAFNIRALVISLVSRKLFNQRMEARKAEEVKAVAKGLSLGDYSDRKENPLVWMFIDEAHEFLPLEGKTPATDALIQLLREGRQPGISLVLATQQPGQIHKDVMTQSDIVISHRVTSEPDLKALNQIMQSYLLDNIKQYMDDLPTLKGSAIILDDNSERIYPARIRPRFTWHGGEAPSALKGEKKL
ncbi:MAG TPA: ATP-binding protein [Candidatus Nanoarchaeia archaeon]|nr:ATP-binding protein [Candidatus Nanoarchaeia archaeon]